MASIQFRLHGKGNKPVTIYLRLSISRANVFEVKTGFSILPQDWSDKTNFPKQNDEINKKLYGSLKKLDAYIHSKLNDDKSGDTIINKFWLEKTIIDCFGRIEDTNRNLVANHIQYIIDNAGTRKVRKAGKIKLGLSDNSIKNYRVFRKLFLRYEDTVRKQVAFTDITPAFVTQFTSWLLSDQKYSVNYSGKNLDILKTVSIDAADSEIPVHPFSKTIQHFRAGDDERYLQTFSFDELDLIRATDMEDEELENTKKWILIGCEIGQRGGDLISLSQKDLRYKNGRVYLDVIQQKGGKHVTCGLIAPHIIEIIENGFPKSISHNELNNSIKEVCKKAGLSGIVEGYKLDTKINRMVFGKYPKFELMASHCFRRSYATNYYKLVPTPVLMNNTGHSKESTFLAYINKRQDKDNNADLFMDFYEKIHAARIPQLKVVNSN